MALLGLQSAAEPPPQEVVDRDGDGVPNDQDICPDEWGTSENMGCPIVEEVKVRYTGGALFAVLCPDGEGVAHVSECQGFSEWAQRYATVEVTNYNPDTHTVDNPTGGEPCGSDVDAKCRCGAGKVKVYDETNNEFPCYDEPPADGCPNWDQAFDFDLRVWACVSRPLDDDPKKLAERVKNCGAPTVRKYWDHSMVLAVNYGFSSGQPDRYEGVGCHPDRNKPPRHVNKPPEGITVTYFRSALENAGDRYSSDWHWAALAPIHENLHVDDFIRFNSCAPWETVDGIEALRDEAGYTERDFNEAGFEKWTRERANKEYFDTFGVGAPEDPRYVTSAHNKPLSCLFQ